MSNILMDPRTVMVIFLGLMAAEVLWSAQLIRTRTQRRKSIESLLLTGLVDEAVMGWLAAWGHRTEEGTPSVQGGRLLLTDTPPELAESGLSS